MRSTRMQSALQRRFMRKRCSSCHFVHSKSSECYTPPPKFIYVDEDEVRNDNKAYVYAIALSSDTVKIGFSTQIKKRLQSIRTTNPGAFLVAKRCFKSIAECKAKEKSLHNILEKKRITKSNKEAGHEVFEGLKLSTIKRIFKLF